MSTPHSLLFAEIEPPAQQDWRPLHFFNVYRIVLAGLLVTTYAGKIAPTFFGQYSPKLFLLAALIYLILGAINSFVIQQRWLPFNTLVAVQGIVDILAITVLMHASGGAPSGLGMLLVVAIAGSGALTAGRTAIFFAAVASLAVLGEAIYSDLYNLFQSTSYTQAGILGATFFATALLAHVLARRIRASEALARQRGLDVQYLAALNEQIVRHIRSGILVMDGLGQLRLCNDAASRLLGIAKPAPGAPLSRAAPQLADLLAQWRRNPGNTNLLFRPENGEVDLIAVFTRLSEAGAVSGGMLIMLEDATLTTRRAEQLKLAALGRLTASIAHEIRNPLGAISHAAQLLLESPNLPEGDRRLSQIVVDHCQRVNGIVESVLQLSRQRDAESACFDLAEWLRRFIAELADYYGLTQNRFVLKALPTPLMIAFDPNQLHQVLWNVCENALRYTQGPVLLELSIGISEESGRPFLDVRDHGPGMSKQIAGQVFEPFFTTEKHGSGLGLYIAQGMCAINRASLHLIGHSPGGCVFRISFSEPSEAVSA